MAEATSTLERGDKGEYINGRKDTHHTHTHTLAVILLQAIKEEPSVSTKTKKKRLFFFFFPFLKTIPLTHTNENDERGSRSGVSPFSDQGKDRCQYT